MRCKLCDSLIIFDVYMYNDNSYCSERHRSQAINKNSPLSERWKWQPFMTQCFSMERGGTSFFK